MNFFETGITFIFACHSLKSDWIHNHFNENVETVSITYFFFLENDNTRSISHDMLNTLEQLSIYQPTLHVKINDLIQNHIKTKCYALKKIWKSLNLPRLNCRMVKSGTSVSAVYPFSRSLVSPVSSGILSTWLDRISSSIYLSFNFTMVSETDVSWRFGFPGLVEEIVFGVMGFDIE